MVKIVQSKPIISLKKGDKIKINGRSFEVDANILLIDHNETTKEMALEIFDAKKDEDFQLRYFPHDLEGSFEFYELQNGFMYTRIKDELKSVEW